MAKASMDGRDGKDLSSTDRKRAEIVRLAAELFDSQGYHGTSVDDIAEAAGIRKPTLYHYFGGKQEILYWIHEEFSQIAIRRQEVRAQRGGSAPDDLVELMYDVISVLDTHPGHVRSYFEYEREMREEDQREIRRHRRHYQAMVRDVVKRGMAEGDFREDVDVDLTVNAIFGMCNWTYQWYRKGGRWKAREVAESFADLVVRGMRPLEVAGERPAAAGRS